MNLLGKMMITTILTASAAIGAAQKTIPFELHNNHIYLQVKVNNSEPLWFILDSGASNTAINSEQISRLKLAQNRQIPIGGAGSETVFGTLLKETSLKIDGLDNFNPPILLAIPFDHLKKFDGRTADGVLGAEFFNNFVVKIDYERREITVLEKEKFNYQGNGEILPLTFKINLPHTNASVILNDGTTVSGDFVIDLGSRFSVALTRQFSVEKGIFEKVIPKIALPIGAGVSGVSKGFVGRLRAVQLGKILIKNPLVSLSQDEKGAFATSQFFEGNIGAEILRKFAVIFDYSRQRMILEKTNRTDSEQVFDKSGIIVVKDNSGYKIIGIIENSPAAEKGIKINDILTEIDGVEAAKFSLDQIRRKFKTKKKTKLKINRGSEIFEVELKLRKLL